MSGADDLEAERSARLVLAQVGEPGLPRLTHAVTELGAVTTLTQLREPPGGEPPDPALLARLDAVDSRAELERAASLGLRFVIPGDPEWPEGLDDLVRAPALHERGGVPLGLWCRGPLNLGEATRSSVAVVGSRSATSYGSRVGADLAADLAAESWTVVSGAAFGIDAAAHRGALGREGPTVAVLACGADRAYPAQHRDLIDYVAQSGLVVSEAAPGWAPTRIRFLARNRLIAALTRGTVVVEAAVRSGALNTATWAQSLGRVVMGVPGPVTSEPSAGVHQLIRSRDALLVTSGHEVLEAVGPMGAFVIDEPRGPTHPRDRLSLAHRQVLDAVPKVHAVPTAKIATTAGTSAKLTHEALRAAHRLGLVEHALGSWRLVEDDGEDRVDTLRPRLPGGPDPPA